jgi:hypothetical protein
MIYVDKGKQFPLNSAHPTQSKECSADSNTSQSTNTISVFEIFQIIPDQEAAYQDGLDKYGVSPGPVIG